jgi:hypothetical protein
MPLTGVMSEMFEGGCGCRSVRYRMSRRPMFVHCCHCRWCQRESGSAFALNALVETAALEVEGQTETVHTPSNSGKGQDVVRCPTCKVALWSHYGGASQIAFIRVGALDDPDEFPPDIHIYTSTKQPWVVLPQGARAVPEYYRASEVWPQESLARRKALFG